MLILDKQKAVERVMALTLRTPVVAPEAQPTRLHARTYHRVATYERRFVVADAAPRRGERRRRRMRLIVAASPV